MKKTKSKKRNKNEISLKGDSSGLFLEVMISIAVFLFAITLAGVLAINSMLSNWSDSILGALTVQIMPVNNIDQGKALEETLVHQNKTMEYLLNVEGVEDVKPLEEKQLQKLLQPWLGDSVDLNQLPIPRLLDVKLNKNAKIDFMGLSEKISEISSQASLDSHKLWLSKLIGFADGLRNLALVALSLVFAITSGAIVYATQTSLGLHRYVINILHIMGAKDTYIAKQFSRRTGVIAFIGGALGVAFAIPTIFMISKLSEAIEGGIISEAHLTEYSWAAIASIPVFYTMIAMVTAYYTVKRTLEKTM
ncbi:MAG: hypothetical protein LBR70_02965 [Lactobacillaceae bacterium]|nr:hypothetical protein [Lactobacillaceae bacterium]